MHAFVLLKTDIDQVDAVSEILWERSSILGIEELPADGAALFTPDNAHDFAHFEPVEAERFTAWLRSEEFRGGSVILLKIHLDAPAQPWIDQLTREHPHLSVLSHGTLPDTDYMAAVREQFQGLLVGETLWVGPPWQKCPSGKIPVIVEPGMAFGLGDHSTTRLCLEIMERLKRIGFHPQRVFDIGTGTGILAIAAARLFPGVELWLSDTDPVCATNVAHNFSLNQLPLPAHRFFDLTATLDKIDAPRGSFDLMLSNLYFNALQNIIPDVAALLRPGSHWIVSGLTGDDQLNEFVNAAKALFPVIDASRQDTWSALVLQAKE